MSTRRLAILVALFIIAVMLLVADAWATAVTSVKLPLPPVQYTRAGIVLPATGPSTSSPAQAQPGQPKPICGGGLPSQVGCR